MPAKLRAVGSAETIEMRPVASKGRKANVDYRVREHPTEAEVDKLLAALKRNRHGHRDWLIGLLIYRHGLRISEACDLRWTRSISASARSSFAGFRRSPRRTREKP